jgi:steroid 5-alpha reductase family enzyme
MQVLWLIGSFLILVFMGLLWHFGYKKTNLGIVDIGWAYCFIIAGIVALGTGEGDFQAKALLSLMIFPWAIRLAAHLWTRFKPEVEDPRYIALRKTWGEDKIIYMFLLQGALAALVSIPFYIIANDPQEPFLLIGFVIVTIGWIGEAIADHQLEKFKSYPSNKGKVMDKGLWGKSRHPNYFFEWVVWVGFTVAAIFSENGYLSLISFSIISYLLIALSGVYLTDKHMEETKGEAWEKYKAQVPAFFPKLFS